MQSPKGIVCIAGLLALCRAQTTSSPLEVPSIISECHLHESTQFCLVVATTEYEVHPATTATGTAVPAQYTGCHTHDGEMFCVDADGNDVEIHIAADEEEDGEDDHDHEDGEDDEHSEEATDDDEGDCHYHAGVKHCTGDSAEAASSCQGSNEEYNIPLRVGLLFVILFTSALGVFGPIFVHKMLPARAHVVFTILKQFGTGVIISTAFVHLYTHASLMFGNECLGELEYESTAAAILMAGLFMSFLVEYLGQRLVRRQVRKEAAAAAAAASSTGNGEGASFHHQLLHQKTEMINILVLEAGIIFHSLLIGLTLVVAGDSFFKTLFIVILFHQMFEGIALGSRIAALGTRPPIYVTGAPGHRPDETGSTGSSSSSTRGATKHETTAAGVVSTSSTASTPPASDSHNTTTHYHHVPMSKKLSLAAAFALVTPIGMAIGIGVLNQFNGNDPATLIAIGTLDAFSAGILVWVGVVEMWAQDWMVPGGELTDAGLWTTVWAFGGLVGGMALMSLLGKWA